MRIPLSGAACCAVVLVTACGGSDHQQFEAADGSVEASSGGTANAGSGGASTGGAPGGGGASSGGRAGSGGVPAGGGGPVDGGTGGVTATGGAMGTGSVSGTGGTAEMDSGAGGAIGSGGASTGGSSEGGPASGGSVGTGGSPADSSTPDAGAGPDASPDGSAGSTGSGGASSIEGGATGGALGTGGSLAAGDASAAGGTSATDAAPGAGGTLGTGGAFGGGGMPGGGGSASDGGLDGGSSDASASSEGGSVPVCQASGNSVDVSGTIDYGGTLTGKVFVALTWHSSVSEMAGTEVTTVSGPPWQYTIRGVPDSQGSYDVIAYVDHLGTFLPNGAADPIGVTPVTLSGVSVNGVNVTLTDPSPSTPPSPSVRTVTPVSGGVSIIFAPVTSSAGFEAADSYRAYVSTSPTPGPLDHQFAVTVPAGQGFVGVSGLVDGTTYHVALTSIAGGNESAPSPARSFVAGAPSVGSTISGVATIPAGLASSASVLYAVAVSAATGVRVAVVPSPTTSQPFAISGVPDGDYRLILLLDRNGDGAFASSDPRVGLEQSPVIVVSGADVSGASLAFPSGWSIASVSTEHFVGGSGDSYGLRFEIRPNRKTPVSAVLCSGPHVVTPSDMTVGHDGEVQVTERWALGSTAPVVGDTYGVIVRYSDGTQEVLDLKVTGVLGAAPTLIAPTGTIASTTPTFTWTLPSTGLPAMYGQRIDVQPVGGSRLWESGDLPPGATSLVYDADGRASSAQLPVGPEISWFLDLVDLNGNHVGTEARFTVSP